MMMIGPTVSAVSAVTVVCSLLSMLGSGFILICYLILPLRYHFRHILILNLALADFLNSLSGSVGGLYILGRKEPLEASRACVFNGFAEQVTVQATDTAILVITITTVYILTMSGPMLAVSEWKCCRIIQTCLAVWTFPFITGFLALGMKWYAPASGNWCWIKAKPVYLRYVLTHGWRFLFIIIEICLYVFLHVRLRRHYQRFTMLQQIKFSGSSPIEIAVTTTTRTFVLSEKDIETTQIEFETPTSSPTEDYEPKAGSTATTSASNVYDTNTSTAPGLEQNSSVSLDSWTFSRLVGLRRARPSNTLSSNPQYQAIQRTLLLNAYPLAYIILWIPGIANRLLEATGHSSEVMQVLQASTQLVGLANALTYGWNERVATQLREKFGK